MENDCLSSVVCGSGMNSKHSKIPRNITLNDIPRAQITFIDVADVLWCEAFIFNDHEKGRFM